MPFDSFLDAGCGTGKLLRRLTDDGYDGRGVEVSDAALSHYLSGLVEDGVVTRAGVENLPYEEDMFDAVICLDVVEHLPRRDVPYAISELVRVANDYMVLSINVDNPYEYHHAMYTRQEWEAFFLATGKVEQREDIEAALQERTRDRYTEYEWFAFEKSVG